jgi:hypothetical protein
MEIWKNIKGYENCYKVSNLGRVKSLKRKKVLEDKIISSKRIDYYGYPYVNLSKNSNTKDFRVHKLVAIVFVDNPNNYSDVDHIDRNKLNNNIENIRWCSSSENKRNSERCDNASSKYNGVAWIKQNKKWRASCNFGGKTLHLGCFNSEIQAAKTFDSFCISKNLDRVLNFN